MLAHSLLVPLQLKTYYAFDIPPDKKVEFTGTGEKK
jgi:hypothetical protein